MVGWPAPAAEGDAVAAPIQACLTPQSAAAAALPPAPVSCLEAVPSCEQPPPRQLPPLLFVASFGTSAAATRRLAPAATCRACEVTLPHGQPPAGDCESCQDVSQSADGHLCVSCYKTHGKGFFPGHAARPWEDPSASLLARLHLTAAPALCSEHPGRHIEFKCTTCQSASLCSLCLPAHTSHGGIVLLSACAAAERGRLLEAVAQAGPVVVDSKAIAASDSSIPCGSDSAPLVAIARHRAQALAAARDKLPLQVRLAEA
jgi:hypothetical protein